MRGESSSSSSSSSQWGCLCSIDAAVLPSPDTFATFSAAIRFSFLSALSCFFCAATSMSGSYSEAKSEGSADSVSVTRNRSAACAL